MSAQVNFVPAGYTQDAIAPFAKIVIAGKPDWDAILEEADVLYDRLAEDDLEGILAQMQFPS